MKLHLSVALAAVMSVAAIATASAEEVNVYSYRQPFLIKPMFDAFTRETGIKVNTVFAKKGLVERIKREGRNSPADLIFTVDIGRLDAVLQAGLTQPISNANLNKKIPAEFRDPNGHWFGLTSRARIIVASKDRVGEDEVKRYEDLASPALKGRVCTRSGKHGYMVALIASIIANSSEEATQTWLTGVKENLARKPQGNDRAQVKAIKEGECDVAIINSYYMGNMMTNEEQAPWADSVRIIFPNQSDRGTHMNISGMSLTASSPNKDNAVKLMEYLAGDKAQRMYAEQNHEYPANPDVVWSALVESWGEFKKDTTPLAEIAKHRNTAAKMVDIVGYDG
ncbi:iron ABC transporter substrate-binding protein [Chromatiales bacterium (ex Bugula neritina AB1)]|nr:iron ABC transporter substrate-binding protein [Chromatiales bacterium (ex Bugula neritina AB1)]